MLETLYKSKAKSIEQWTIIYGRDMDGAFYEISFGQLNGVMQRKRNYVDGKNIGKANETTCFEQAKKEAEARWKKQFDKGYVIDPADTNNDIPLLPMLAKNYDDEKDKVIFPAFVQPKLDGCRCLAYLENGEVFLMSRKGKRFRLPHLEKSLKENVFIGVFANWILDGELYVHGVPFQSIISWIKKEQTQSLEIQYHVYDMVDSENSFAERYKKIRVLNGLSNCTKIVETITVYSHEAIKQAHLEYVSKGYEGVMVRWGEDEYQLDKRSSNLLKLKFFITEEFFIVSAIEDDNSPGQCCFVLTTEDGTHFNCKPKGDVSLREAYWKNKEKYIGKQLTVRFPEWTTSEQSVPRFPVGICCRDYE